MQVILDTALPFFALVFCGYGAGRFGLLSEASASGLNTFVFYFALPAFIFVLLATTPIDEALNASFAAAYLMAGLGVAAVAAFLGVWLFASDKSSAVLRGASASLGNTGYMGLPLIAAAFGNEAAVAMALGLTLEVIFMMPLAIILLEADKGPERKLSDLVSTVALALVKNPIIIAIAAGAAVSFSGFDLFSPVGNFAELLGDAAGPCALFTLGATLAGRQLSGGLAEISYLTFFKLAAHPAAMWATMTLFGVNPLWTNVAILAASLPVAANVFILARQYDTYIDRTSGAILVSTIVSVATVSALLILLT
ncbi:MAG: AEC family transporter [Rubrobacter sp.]|nr:AEC family transporter [Rubrobacter sp.]